MNENFYTVDNFGNMLDESGNYVGYYDTVEKVCILYDTGQPTPCPQNMKEPKQVIVKDSRTFYWVVLVAFILFVILGSYIYFKTRNTAQ